MSQSSNDNRTRELIRSNEGFRSDIYKDTKGINTVGYGFNITQPHVRRMMPKDVLTGTRELSRPEASMIQMLLQSQAERDAVTFLGDANVYGSLTPARKAALVDMAYHLGGPRLGSFQQMRKAILAQNWRRASRELMDSKYGKKDTPKRAKRNAALMLSGE